MLDILFLVAEAREIASFLRTLTRHHAHFYQGSIHGRTIGVWIIGVGKHSVKRNLKKLAESGVTATRVVNLGNVGALRDLRRGTVVKVGEVLGENGKQSVWLDRASAFRVVSVNGIQSKDRLRNQYPHADVVDMELFTLVKQFPNSTLESYKMVLDTFGVTPHSWRFYVVLPWWVWRNNHRWRKFISNYLLNPSHS